MKRRCYIYTRVSTAAQVEGFSLEAQTKRLYEYAEFKDLDIAGEYCDAGKSGKSITGRPEFQRMLEDIIREKDNISFVIVFKLSRFGRNAADVLNSLRILMDFNVDLISVDDAIDSSTQGGRLTLTILSAVAEIERENITEQFMAGKRQKIMDGKWSGGAFPYGYHSVNRELVLIPEEAEIVKLIFELYLRDDMKVGSVVSYLNRNGYVRNRGKKDLRPFTSDFVTAILDNPLYCGKLMYGRRTNKKGPDGKPLKADEKNIISVEGAHEKIITEEQWNIVQKKRQALKSWGQKTDDPDRISLLSGLVKCPACGAGMVSKKDRHINKNHGGHYKTLHYYYCRNSTGRNGKTCDFTRSYNQEKVDQAVYEAVVKFTGHPEFREAVGRAAEDKETLKKLEESILLKKKELHALELQSRKKGQELDNLDILKKDYDELYGALQAEIDAGYDRILDIEDEIKSCLEERERLRAGLRAPENIESLLNRFREIYDSMTCQEKRNFYRLFIDRIDVFPDIRADGRVLESISFRFAVGYGEDGLVPKDEGGEHIRFIMDCTRTEISAAEAKATYAELKKYIYDRYGTKVSNLYIAQTKRKYGLNLRPNYNLAVDPVKHVPNCPRQKEVMIFEALKHFKMLDETVELLESEGI